MNSDHQHFFMESQHIDNKKVKAVGLISGGLDSALAARVMKDVGVDVYGVFFAMPWGCCDKAFAQKIADGLEIPLITLQLDERYLEVVRSPRFGRGFAMNPCKDCRIHMFSRAAQYMRHVQADFCFTGEVLGQRPMSQKKVSMALIEKEAGLQGKLLRPLSAQRLPPTEIEEAGLVDRSRLLDFVGRGRSRQYALAEKLGIDGYSAPAGGCQLTTDDFSNRIQDTFQYGYRNFRETISLKWGRHFRLSADFKCIVGRSHDENESLQKYAHPEDYIMIFQKHTGPVGILKGPSLSEEMIEKTAGLMRRYSKHRKENTLPVVYWQKKKPNHRQLILSRVVSEQDIQNWKIT